MGIIEPRTCHDQALKMHWTDVQQKSDLLLESQLQSISAIDGFRLMKDRRPGLSSAELNMVKPGKRIPFIFSYYFWKRVRNGTSTD